MESDDSAAFTPLTGPSFLTNIQLGRMICNRLILSTVN